MATQNNNKTLLFLCQALVCCIVGHVIVVAPGAAATGKAETTPPAPAAKHAAKPAKPAARILSGITERQNIHARLRHYDNLVGDFNRPRWHLASPDWNWWDMNGGFEIDGRYHISFLRSGYNADASPDGNPNAGKRWTWGHATSRDLFHWRFRPDIFSVVDAEKTPNFYSGHSVYDAPVPTLIFYVRERGVFVAQARDRTLEEWTFLNDGNPVIPGGPTAKGDMDGRMPGVEFWVFDPFAWFDSTRGVYFGLIGNHNNREGYSASPSLFTSKDLITWEYIGPVLKDQPEWLTPKEDTACVDFFPLGESGKWVMLCHVHYPYFHTRAMVGVWDGREFTPERITRMGGIHSNLFAPETFRDSTKKRRIYFGTTDMRGKGWETAATQPLELKLSPGGELEFHPVEELESLCYNKKSFGSFALDNDEKPLENTGSLSMLLKATIAVGSAQRAGFKMVCAPDGSEYAIFEYLPGEKVFRIDFSKSFAGKDMRVEKFNYHRALKDGFTEITGTQDIPFFLKDGEKLHVQIFRDGALFEVIVNNRAFTVQPIYNSSKNSVQIRAFSEGGRAEFESVETADIDASMSL